jgi:hypothetical protein
MTIGGIGYRLRNLTSQHSVKGECIALFALGYFGALIQLRPGSQGARFGAGFESLNIARSLVATGQFSDPFSFHTGSTAHAAPLYPLILAATFKLFGESTATLIVLFVLNAAFLGAASALLPLISQRVFGSSHPGVAGGVLFVFGARLAPQGDGALSVLLLVLAALAILEGKVWQSGLWAGLSALSNPVSFLMLGFGAVFRGKRFAAIVLALALTVCAPWILRNWAMLGAPYFVRDNLGLELFLSNSDDAQPELVRNTRLPRLHPMYNRGEAALLAELGEGPYNRLRLTDALRWIHGHPTSFLRLCAARAFLYWFPSPGEGFPSYTYWLVSALGFTGAWLARNNRTAMVIAGAAIIYSLPYVAVQADIRYGFPALWAPALLAGYSISTARARILAMSQSF